MKLFVLYDTHTSEWTIALQNEHGFIAKSVFISKDKIHAFVIAAGYLSLFSDMTIDSTSELAWRQLGLKAARELEAMQ
jgi:hypothetical protein